MLLESIDNEAVYSPDKVSDASTQEIRLWQSLRNCWLIVPLVYFATNGNFLWRGDALHGTDMGDANASSMLLTRSEQIGAWFLVVLLTYPYYRSVVRAWLENKMLSALFCFTAISALWSSDPTDSLRRVVLLLLTVSFAYLLVERFRSEELMRLVYVAGCVAVIGSLILVAVAPAYGLMPTGEWKGIFAHKNETAIVLSLMLSPIFFMRMTKSLSSLTLYFCGLLGAVLIAATGSRTGWVVAAALITYAGWTWVIRRFSKRDAMVLSAALLGVGAGIGWLAVENYTSVTYLLGKDPTLSNRAQIWNAVLAEMAKRPWIGYGYGGFWNGLHGPSINVVSALGVSITHAHNGYLNVAVQIGLIGLGLFLVVLVLGLKRATTSFYIRPSKAGLWYGSILFMIIVGSAGESFLLNYDAMSTILFVTACVGLRKIAAGEDGG